MEWTLQDDFETIRSDSGYSVRPTNGGYEAFKGDQYLGYYTYRSEGREACEAHARRTNAA